MYELYFRQRVDRGLEELEQGKTVSHEEVKRVQLPTFGGQGLLPGVDLDDSASLLELMESGDANVSQESEHE